MPTEADLVPRPDRDDDDAKVQQFTTAMGTLTAVLASAVETEAATKRAEIAARSESHRAALAANDAVDARDHVRSMERMKLEHQLGLIRVFVLSIVVLASMAGLGAIGAQGYIREVVEVVGAVVLTAMGYIAGDARGQLKRKRADEEKASED